jgi:hypothetical protein
VLFELYRKAFFIEISFFTLLIESTKGAIIGGHRESVNGSAKDGILLAAFPCRAKSNLSLLEVHTEKG